MARISQLFSLAIDVVWCYLTKPRESLKNTHIIVIAVWRTYAIGSRAFHVLKNHEHSWSDRTRSRYIWRVAQKFWAPWILDRAGIDIVVTGLERLTDDPYVVVVNHSSVLDILATTAILPDCRFVAKIEVLKMPIFGKLARYGGQVIIDRSDKKQSMTALRTNTKSISRGNLLIFPEGTRTSAGSLGIFKYGGFAIAKENNLPILPVAIDGISQVTDQKGNFLHLVPGSRITVAICPSITVSDVARFEVPILAEHARSIIVQKLKENVA